MFIKVIVITIEKKKHDWDFCKILDHKYGKYLLKKV